MNTDRKRIFPVAAALGALVLCAGIASGQQLDEYGDVSAPVGQTVARVGFVEGNVSYARGDDPDNWQAVDSNVPVTIGDRIYADDRSRVELQVEGGDVVRLGAKTDLATLNLTEDTRQFAVKSGHATFDVRRLDQDENWEVDTPNAAVTLERAGRYRVDVDQDGNTRISVGRGAASVAAGGGQLDLKEGDAVRIDGTDSPRYAMESAAAPDGWERWNDERENRIVHARSAQYVSPEIVGADDLDQYGEWQQVPNYGWCWSPARVEAGWVPYRAGHWVWQDPWGWTWVSTEPWGWAPYHYGRWVTSSSRWFWVPVAPGVQVVSYAPALVGFVGGGPGVSVSVGGGGGDFVGWFPLAPRDPFVPWWGARREVNVNVTNVTYVNRTYVTVVNQNTFVSGAVVTNNIVRDRAVLQRVEAAPVVRGAIPVIPTAASMHASIRTATAARPPSAVVSRSVVARVAPPPAPPRFDQKLAMIRENRGAPVTAQAAAQLAVQRGQPRATTQVRTAMTQSGQVSLAPAKAAPAGAAAPRVQALTTAPIKGRAVATADKPVASAPVVGQRSAAAQRGQVVPREKEVPPAQPAGRPAEPAGRPAQAAPGQPAFVQPTRPATETLERRMPPTARPERQVEPQNKPIERPAQTPNWRLRPTPARPEREAEPANRPPVERRQPTPDRERNAPPSGRAQEKVQPTPNRERNANVPNRGPERVQPTPERYQRQPATQQETRERVESRQPERAQPETQSPQERSREQQQQQQHQREQQQKKKPKPTPPPG